MLLLKLDSIKKKKVIATKSTDNGLVLGIASGKGEVGSSRA